MPEIYLRSFVYYTYPVFTTSDNIYDWQLKYVSDELMQYKT
jgi:hypothetical protein